MVACLPLSWVWIFEVTPSKCPNSAWLIVFELVIKFSVNFIEPTTCNFATGSVVLMPTLPAAFITILVVKSLLEVAGLPSAGWVLNNKPVGQLPEELFAPALWYPPISANIVLKPLFSPFLSKTNPPSFICHNPLTRSASFSGGSVPCIERCPLGSSVPIPTFPNEFITILVVVFVSNSNWWILFWYTILPCLSVFVELSLLKSIHPELLELTKLIYAPAPPESYLPIWTPGTNESLPALLDLHTDKVASGSVVPIPTLPSLLIIILSNKLELLCVQNVNAECLLPPEVPEIEFISALILAIGSKLVNPSSLVSKSISPNALLFG